jgi:protoheme IX farnesyltransferase
MVRRLRLLLRDYKLLSKARLSALVVSTSAAGYAAGSKEKIDWAGLGWCSLGTGMCASAANTLNQVYEVANDARMKRTMGRPLPAGRMSKLHALAFAAVLSCGGIYLLKEKVGACSCTF